MKKSLVILFLLALTQQGTAQYLLVEDIDTQKTRKIKFGKELIVITKTDTLDYFDSVLNDESGELEEVWTGYWYLSKINVDNNSIEVWNNLDERQVIIPTSEIEALVFKQADRAIHRKILLGVCFGGIAWAAVSENSTQSIAAIGITLASAAYLASTVKQTKYRKYRLISLNN